MTPNADTPETTPYQLTIYYEATDVEADFIYDAIVDAASDILDTTYLGEEAFGFATGGPADFAPPE